MEIRREQVVEWNRVTHQFASIIAVGFIDGDIRPVHPYIASQMLTAGINAASEMPPDRLSEREIAELYAARLLAGMVSTVPPWAGLAPSGVPFRAASRRQSLQRT